MPGWVCLGAIPSVSPATGVLNNSSGLPATGQWPFNLSQGCRRADGLHVPAGQPGVVGQGGGTLKGSSQELSTIQVLRLAAVVRACVHKVVQVLPEEVINMKVVLMAFLCYQD